MQIDIKNTSTIIPQLQKTDYIVGSDLIDNLHRLEVFMKKDISEFLILSDRNVFHLYGQKIMGSLKNIKKPIIVSLIPTGEKSKNIANIPTIVRPFFKYGFTRNAAVISLGGGVVTDIGGFLASILLRGIASIHIPTTLLGQADASIGGKSGVDFWFTDTIMCKNMIGRIEQPSTVICDVDTLSTLPEKEIVNGLGEMVKYWIGWGIPSVERMNMLKNTIQMPDKFMKDSCNVKELIKIISLCQQIKIDLMQKDPFDRFRIREKLNLGHTIGHALEGTSKGILSHGESVSIGLVAAAKISKWKGLLTEETLQLIIDTIKKLGLPEKASNKTVSFSRSEILSALKMDKKAGTFVLIEDIGKIRTHMLVDKKFILRAVSEAIS